MWVLASSSPRRQALLQQIDAPFTVDVPRDVDETVHPLESGALAAERLARVKAAEVATRHPGAWIIAADTLVCLGDRILGKPADAAEAVRMLEAMSGRAHVVVTGVAVVHPGGIEAEVDTTEVQFRPLSRAEIEAYVATGEPLDKAGSYGLQGRGVLFVEGIRGDHTNVVGLPLGRLGLMLQRLGRPL
jgi:septum formation protein